MADFSQVFDLADPGRRDYPFFTGNLLFNLNMVKFLGILDILAAGLLAGSAFQLAIPAGLVIGFAVYLFLKALLFLLDIGSLFDIIGGILLILTLSIALPQVLLFIAAGLVGLKGIMSLFA